MIPNYRILLALLALAVAAPAQVAEKANESYRTEEARKQLIEFLLRPGRDESQKPRELIQALGLKPGLIVADVGTGPGYMLPFLSRAVTPGGRVFAQDIFPDFLQRAALKAKTEGLDNVTTVQGNERDASLPTEGTDVILVLDAYHHFDYPEPMLASLRRALRRNGRLVLVDYYRRPGALPRADIDVKEHIRADRDEVVREIEAAGFRLVRSGEHIPGSQYIVVFERNGP